MPRPPPRYDHAPAPVAALAVDYPSGHETARHRHRDAQLIYAVSGVMRVETAQGQWVVPPTRGLWVPPETDHAIHMIGPVRIANEPSGRPGPLCMP